MQNILPFGWTIQAAMASTKIQELVTKPNPAMLADLATARAKAVAAHRAKAEKRWAQNLDYPTCCFEESQAFAHQFAKQWQEEQRPALIQGRANWRS